jgi:hypothetical protein
MWRRSEHVGLPPPGDPIDISAEAEIVWVKGGPDDYPYLHEGFRTSTSRTRPFENPGLYLVAYAKLRPDAPALRRGTFLRRIWKFRPDQDSCQAEHGHDIACPLDAVKPHSIKPRQRSEWGRA